MKPAALALLAAVTGLAVLGAVASQSLNAPPAPPERAGDAVYPALSDALSGVARIRLTTPLIDFTFESDGEVWRVNERDGWPADMQKLAETLFALADLVYVEPKTADPERYARLQIEDPAAPDAASRRITVEGAAGETLADVIAGRRKFDLAAGTATRGLYIRLAGEDRGWLAAGGLSISDDAQSWLEDDLLAVDPARVQRITLVHRDGERVEIERDDRGFFATTLPRAAQPKRPKTFENVASALADVKLADVGRLSDIAFEGGTGTEATVETEDGLTVNLTVLMEARDDSGDRPRRWTMVSAKAAAGASDAVAAEAAAITARTEGWMFLLPDWEGGQLTVRNADLVKPADG